MENWQQNNDVVEFENSENPSKDLMARAYYLRDLGMGLTFEHVFNHSIDKLGLNPLNYENLIKAEFQLEARYRLNAFFENPENQFYNNLAEAYNSFVEEKLNSEEYVNRRQKYENLLQIYHNNNHEQFYLVLSEDDLACLGW